MTHRCPLVIVGDFNLHFNNNNNNLFIIIGRDRRMTIQNNMQVQVHQSNRKIKSKKPIGLKKRIYWLNGTKEVK